MFGMREHRPEKGARAGGSHAGGEILLDPTGKKSGRGAYLCQNPDCLKKARKARRLERAFDCKIPDEVYERLEREMGEPPDE